MSESPISDASLCDPGPDRHWYRWLWVAALVVAVDQLTKWYVIVQLEYGEQVAVLPFFRWVRWHNDGAAFSFLSGSGGWQRWFFVALALAFTVFIVVELRRLTTSDRLLGLVYGLILGGALGNMVDRLRLSYVVDFIRFQYQDWGFPAFNVADICLFCGASLWILSLLLTYRKEKTRN